MSKVVYTLEGLGCANCAAKIEDAIRHSDGVIEAYVDFSKSKLVYSYDESNNPKLTDSTIEDIVHRFEPDVKVIAQLKNSSNTKTESTTLSAKESFERIRLIISLLLFIIAMTLNTSIRQYQFYFLVITYVLSGYPVIRTAIRNILNKQWFDENFLMSIATVGAFAIGEYPEAVAVMLFYEIGEYFQDLAVGKSRASIASLMNIKPEIAHILKHGETIDVLPSEVSIGDTLRVRAGERIPLDGLVVNGSTDLDTSALTGESKPKHVSLGESVLSGSVVLSGVIDLTVTKDYEDSTVSKILELVEDATAHKAPTENFITKFARYYTPIVVLLASLIVVVPTLFTGIEFFSTWLYRGLIFLVISCPCALVISVPLSFFSGIGNASNHGILVKGSNYLEALNTIDTIVFDKTGTLTYGKMKVESINPNIGVSAAYLLEVAGRSESQSNHPIARAIVLHSNYKPSPHMGFADLSESYEEVGGKGIKAYFSNKMHYVGTAKFLMDQNIDFKPLEETHGTVVYVTEDDQYLGAIVLADEIKAEAYDTIRTIHSLGKNVIMLTGDHRSVAEYVSSALGIDQYYAELLPSDKYEIVSGLIAQGKRVAFIGDGINDAPVLAGASVGISMGQIGSDAAIEASDIVIMQDDLNRIPQAFKISHKTKTIVMQNIVFAIGIKVVIMILGTFGLSSMWMAIFADVGVALIAILNAMRILKYDAIKAANIS